MLEGLRRISREGEKVPNVNEWRTRPAINPARRRSDWLISVNAADLQAGLRPDEHAAICLAANLAHPHFDQLDKADSEENRIDPLHLGPMRGAFHFDFGNDARGAGEGEARNITALLLGQVKVSREADEVGALGGGNQFKHEGKFTRRCGVSNLALLFPCVLVMDLYAGHA